MTKTTKTWLGTLLALAAACLFAPEAKAVGVGSPSFLNIDVTVTANLSVSVNGVNSSSYTGVTWNTGAQAQLTGSTATVKNDSGAQTEKWALSTNATSIDQGAAGSWTLSASSTAVGADAFALQAVFGSTGTASCPAGGATDWNDGNMAPLLTTALQTYASTKFADSTLNAGGNGALLLYNPDVTAGAGNGRMLAGSQRALCWRIVTPTTTSTIDQQNIQVIVTAQNP